MALKLKLVQLLKEDFKRSTQKAKSDIEKYRKDLDKYKSSSKLLYNKFSNFAIGDLLEESGIGNFKRINEAAEKFRNKLDSEHDKILEIADEMSEEYDESRNREANELYHDAGHLAVEYNNLSEGLEIIYDISEKLIGQVEHMMEYDKLKHLKDFQQGIQ